MSAAGDIGGKAGRVAGRVGWGRFSLVRFTVAHGHVGSHAAWGRPVMLRQDYALRSEGSSTEGLASFWSDLVQQHLQQHLVRLVRLVFLVFPSVYYVVPILVYFVRL